MAKIKKMDVKVTIFKTLHRKLNGSKKVEVPCKLILADLAESYWW